MSDLARNTRTLISSFVIALAVLVPLRFYQVGEQTYFNELDAQTSNKVASMYTYKIANAKRAMDSQVASVPVEPTVLGVYDENQMVKTCVEPELVPEKLSNITGLTEAEYMAAVQEVLNNVCK